MLERALIALAIVAALLAALWLGRRLLAAADARTLRRLRAITRASADASAGARLVYFTTTTCVVCRVQQEPALAALRAHMPQLRIEQHDAVAEPALAAEYAVRSVPTIAVYGRDGALVTIHRGFVPAAVLRSELEGTPLRIEGGAELAGELLDPSR